LLRQALSHTLGINQTYHRTIYFNGTYSCLRRRQALTLKNGSRGAKFAAQHDDPDEREPIAGKRQGQGDPEGSYKFH
jgi:hypothetical protein